MTTDGGVMNSLPGGCNKSFQVSYIEDESMRPDKESCWLISGIKDGRRMVTCRTSLEQAIKEGEDFIK